MCLILNDNKKKTCRAFAKYTIAEEKCINKIPNSILCYIKSTFDIATRINLSGDNTF